MPEIKNPNQPGGGSGMDTRSLLTMSFVFLLVFLGLTYWKGRNNQKDAPSPVQNSAAQQAPSPTGTVAPTGAVIPGGVATAAGSTGTTAASAVQQTIVENELYRITFSNKGAEVTSWILKKFKDDRGQPLDLVNADTSKQFGNPLSTYVYDSGLRGKLAGAMYVPSTTGALNTPGELTFTWTQGGLSSTKSFRFDQSYVLHATSQVTVDGGAVTSLLNWPAALGDQVTPALYASGQVDYEQNGSVTHIATKKVSGGGTFSKGIGWAGISDLYFAAIFLPDNPAGANLMTAHETASVARDPLDKNNSKFDSVPVLGAAVGDTGGITALRIYAGPKALDIIKNVHATGPDGRTNGESLEPLIDFGFWAFLAKPLFLWLHWTYDHIVHNWGWSILLLTLIINLAVLPLRVATMRSSLKMAKIQPQVAQIRERYKKYKMGDPKQADMNRELQALYKTNDVNMFGGCLPTLIQFPLLFAFYAMLSKAIDLRQAHFLWLHDLSHPDPYHLLPVFLILSMFLTSWLTPNPGMDPAQRKMMAVTMPATMGIFFWNVSSGLSLYYAFANVIGVTQQLVMNKGQLGQQMRDLAAKRARKKAGLGKVIQGRR